MIRVSIADDHRLVRQGLRLLLEPAEDIQVVGEAENGYEAVEKSSALSPDVFLMDADMPFWMDCRPRGLSAPPTCRRTSLC